MKSDKAALEKAREIYSKISNYKTSDNFVNDPEIYRKMIEQGGIGRTFYNIFNVGLSKVEYASPEVKSVWGYEPKEVTLERYLGHIHRADLPYVIAFEEAGSNFYSNLSPNKVVKYKCTYDYRLRRQDGKTIRLLQQTLPIESDHNGAVLRSLAIFTDITHVKKGYHMSLSMIGLDGEPSFLNLKEIVNPNVDFNPFTPREREVLVLLAKQLTTAEIAEILSISKSTVVNHRKNMLRKRGKSSSLALVMEAKENGWV